VPRKRQGIQSLPSTSSMWTLKVAHAHLTYPKTP
jgi:hypothetical protein